MSEERFAAIESKLDAHTATLDELTVGQRALREDVRDLGRQMHVLHEDTIERIAALAPDFGPIRREFKEADAKLREDINRRLTPLELAVRSTRGKPAGSEDPAS